jgi:hypothetical protein
MFSGAAIASSTKPVLIATGLITLANPIMTNKFNQSRCDEYNGLLIFFYCDDVKHQMRQFRVY